VISADCHCGGRPEDYRAYLPEYYQEAFDAWLTSFTPPFEWPVGVEGERNWNSDRHLQELEEDGVVAAVLFPNTIVPFWPELSITFQPPATSSAEALELWWVG